MDTLKTYFLNLNFFQSSNPINQPEEHEHRSNIIATRVYIIIYGITLSTLILSLWLSPKISQVILQYPTQNQFQALPIDTQCPCSRISLSYGQFVSIQTRFHQVCSSDFVSNRWIKAIFYDSDSIYFHQADFRTIGSAQFRALSSLCDLTETNIRQSIASFNMRSIISPYVLSQSAIQLEVQTSIEQLRLTTSDTFVKQLDFVRKMIIGNQLLSALETNIVPLYLQVFNKSLQLGHYIIYNISNDSYCDCQINVNCRVPSGIFKEFEQSFTSIVFDNTRLMLIKIDGFSAGCMPMDSILQSTLQCFYNQTCLNTLLSFLSTNESFIAMNISKYSRFKPNSTVQEIVNELMVEEWLTNISYEKYYAQCAPVQCTYSKLEKQDLINVLTNIISLHGGLTLTLRFIITRIVRFIRRKKDNESSSRISCMYYTV
ncbi:unnamed protein product [Rotaria sordida]|uniref:Uncharacterized protein n=2 Tax=Rotaria sordida TaxID=392033 RepID=A0A819QPL9_9BILA|nr:unnamed protein product [Rotaria sordida]